MAPYLIPWCRDKATPTTITVIIPFVPRYGGMLQRNLLYTAVTRAKRKVIIVGTTSAVERAVRTVNADERYTLFKERLQGRCDS